MSIRGAARRRSSQAWDVIAWVGGKRSIEPRQISIFTVTRSETSAQDASEQILLRDQRLVGASEHECRRQRPADDVNYSRASLIAAASRSNASSPSSNGFQVVMATRGESCAHASDHRPTTRDRAASYRPTSALSVAVRASAMETPGDGPWQQAEER
jgi:hypothetical protein